MSKRISWRLAGLSFVMAAAVMSIACGLFGGGEDTGNAAAAAVRSIALSSEVDREGQPVNARLLFAPNVPEIRAIVTLTGAEPGMKVTGRFYLLGPANAGAEGQEYSSSEVTLDSQTAQNGNARVSFVQRSGAQGLPEDAWLLRVFINGELVRTSAFVVSRSAPGGANPAAAGPQPTAAPASSPTPVTQPTVRPTAVTTPTTVSGTPAASSTPTSAATPATGVATNYTVQTGDTLGNIAARFFATHGAPGESAAAFSARIAALNSLGAEALLLPGQVLRIPPPQ